MIMYNPEPPPKQHSIEKLFPGRIIKRRTEKKDEDINETIQSQGAHLGLSSFGQGDVNEALWYYRNKGYSEKL